MGWQLVFMGVAAGAATYSAVDASQRAASAQKAAKKQVSRQLAAQLEAGEYYEELNKKQMELQAQSSQMKLLADIITAQGQPQGPVLQLPAAKTYTPIERMNQAIDDWFKGG